MKILPAVVLIVLGSFFSQLSFAQEITAQSQAVIDSEMMDTLISKDPAFLVRKVYTVRDSLDTIQARISAMQDTTIAMETSFVISDVYSTKDILDAARALAITMQDTTIAIDPSFTVNRVYAYQDSINSMYGGYASRRDSLIHAFKDSLSAIGEALMRAAEMQDTIINLQSGFMVFNVYAVRDSSEAVHDSLRAMLALAATMQDTAIEIDPSFVVMEVYAKKDSYMAFRDSVWAALSQARKMQDTTIEIDPSFVTKNVYEVNDRLDEIRDSLAWPTIMRDTVISIDSLFMLQDLYIVKDSLDAIRDSITTYRDSVYTDSVNRHWAGWKKYQVQPDHIFSLNTQRVLKGIGKSSLQNNIADIYLYLNGELVKPETPEYNFFAAGCLAFLYNDTLLLNSGLGFRVGVGVSIKIIQGRFLGSLHANKRNQEIYKVSAHDSVYKKSIVIEPNNQSLIMQFEPSYQPDEIVSGEYQASFKKFYEKTGDGQDEIRQYSVKIVFRCRVTGGLNDIQSRQ